MNFKLKEKLAICYVCCGPTYRKSVFKKLSDYYFDDENLHYCILTDDKSYFKDLKRQNLTINELEDFSEEFPTLKDKEVFLKSSDRNDYAQKFINERYFFPMSTYRFCFLQAIKLNIKNVVMMGADTILKFEEEFFKEAFDRTEMFYNCISEFDTSTSQPKAKYSAKILKEKHNLIPDEIVRGLDAPARMYIPKDLDALKRFFYLWNDVIETLYESGEIEYFKENYMVVDECILAPIYNVLNLNKRICHCLQFPFENPSKSIFEVNHNALYERFWMLGTYPNIKDHTNYEEFLKINNLLDYE